MPSIEITRIDPYDRAAFDAWWDADEAMQAAQHRTSYGTVALASDGRMVGYTQIVVSREDGNAYQ